MSTSGASHLAEIKRLYDVMGRVNSGTDLSEVLRAIADGVVSGLGFGVAAISQLVGDTLITVAVEGEDEEVRQAILGRRRPVNQVTDEFEHADEWGILRFVPHDRLPEAWVDAMWVPDIEANPEPDGWHPLDTLYAPLYAPTGELLGIMSVDIPPDNKIPDQGLRELLEMFAVQAGVALYNAQQRERLAEGLRLGAAVRRVITEAGQAREVEDVLILAAGPLVEGLRAKALWLRTFADPGSGTEEQSVAWPPEMEKYSTPGVRQIARRASQQVWKTHRPVLITRDMEGEPGLLDSESLPQLLAPLEGEDGASVLAVPMGAGDEVLGHIVLMRGLETPEWSEAEIDCALEMGRELGRTVHQARLFARERRLVNELLELDRYKAELTTTLTHELKGPLTAIMGHAEMLGDSGASPRSVAAINDNVRRLSTMVEDVLSFSRLDNVPAEMPHEKVDLSELCRSSLERVRVTAEGAGTQLAFDEPIEPMVVLGNATDLSRVVDNLVGNAVKYTPRGGRVELAVRRVGEEVELTCTDTGLGIAESDLPTLFAPFDRSSNPEARALPGSGLGLTIAQRIVHRHGGSIEVASTEGEGSTFTVRLPVAA